MISLILIMIIYFTSILMLKYHTIYAYMYEKEMKHCKNDLEFELVFQDIENIFFVYIRLKSAYRFLFTDWIHKSLKLNVWNRCLIAFKRYEFKRFTETFNWPCTHAHRQLTFIVTSLKTDQFLRRYVVKKIICETTI